MAKAEWGMKRTCHTCGARFYDLRRDPILCPHCGAVFDPERQPKPKRPGPLLKEEPAAASRLRSADIAADDDLMEVETPDGEVEDLDESGEETADDELAAASGELMEDTSELGEDDDDLTEVMEHVDDEMEDKP